MRRGGFSLVNYVSIESLRTCLATDRGVYFGHGSCYYNVVL